MSVICLDKVHRSLKSAATDTVGIGELRLDITLRSLELSLPWKLQNQFLRQIAYIKVFTTAAVSKTETA